MWDPTRIMARPTMSSAKRCASEYLSRRYWLDSGFGLMDGRRFYAVAAPQIPRFQGFCLAE